MGKFTVFNKTVHIKKVIITLVMLGIGLFFLSPFLWMLSTSFKPESEVFRYPIQWIPDSWNAIANYRRVWLETQPPFSLYYWNSIKVTVFTTLISVSVSSLAAYSFAKVRFKGREIVFLLVLATYMVPPQTLFVPQFILYRWLGLYDSHLGLVFLHCFSVLGTFMLRQFFLSVHDDFLESAKMDGAGHFKIFLRIGLPIVQPAIATYAILRFIWTWNDYQMPLIFLHSEKLHTLQLGINQFADMNGQFYSLVMAGAVSAILPLFVIFIIGQKRVIEGIQLGGVKG